MYTPQNTVLSEDSYAILNAIRNEVGGMFRANTPLVANADSAKAYGLYVTGSGDARNVFMGALMNRIAQVTMFSRSYRNKLARYKKGMLELGEVIENVWVQLVAPEGYTQSPENPGDLFKQNVPDSKVTFHPVNCKIVYEVTVNDSELSMAFTTSSGLYDFVSKIMQRLTDSDEWDSELVERYVIARAILDNASAVTQVSEPTAANADSVIAVMKGASNEMRFMTTNYNVENVPTHTPVENQIFFLTADSSAKLDVYSLAKAFNISYDQFLGQQDMIRSFGFNAAELERLNRIMQISVAQGVIPNYTEFTEDELAYLNTVVGAIIDEDFFMIFDRLYRVDAAPYDSLHLSQNTFLHHWSVNSYNPFANARFFAYGTAPTAK